MHTNMDSSIDRWLFTDNLFSYVPEASLTYLSKSKKSSLPTLSKDTSVKLMDLLNLAIKSTFTFPSRLAAREAPFGHPLPKLFDLN